ncbi:MAG TPA: hypothetical protein VFN35_10105 [Ktedonobacteraceae bacterium]|nr:hypothetical protein [Ktedonobacteraceae bacterium]
MILSEIEAAVRLDLFDPAGSSQRWSSADLERAIARAVDRYTRYAPNINWSDMHTRPFQRTYPYPIPANPNYPPLWIERIVYPLQVYGSAFSAPSSGPILEQGSPGNVNGIVQYALTFLTPGGETTAGPATSISVSNRQVLLNNIPLGPDAGPTPGTVLNCVIGRNLYRTVNGGDTFYLLTCLRDNSTTAYIDNSMDSDLNGQPSPPEVNSSGVMYWPPRERDFAEYSNLSDATTALAAGGNMGRQGTVGSTPSQIGAQQQAFTLKLSNAELPTDATLVMRIFYATMHQLDNDGSTIPEIHRDILTLGACAYAMEAYQAPTNDNFNFQDGEIRDRVDDTAIPKAWLAAATGRIQQFETSLKEIKAQRELSGSSRAHWGEIPGLWSRL